MKPLHLDFVERPRLPVVALLSILIGAVWGMATLYEWRDIRSNVQLAERRRENLSRLIQERRKARTQGQAAADAGPELDAWRQVQRNLNYPWNQIFSTVEQSRPPNLRMASLDYGQSSSKGAMSVEANDLETITEFVRALNEGLEGNQWYIAGYKIVAGAGMPIKASLLQH
jgi:hypothetical protein